MTIIDILNPKLIVSDDYYQFQVHFEWFLALFHISDEKWLLYSLSEEYNEMGLVGLKT